MIGTDWNSFYDDNYQYLWSDEELYIFENGTGNCLYVLTYPTDKWYINGNNACLKDGIFYGASVTNGYCQPDTCSCSPTIWKTTNSSGEAPTRPVTP